MENTHLHIKLFKNYGIIINANIYLKIRWQSIKDIMEKEGYNLPNELPIEGLIFSNGEVKIGVWIMPNNNLNGMLEDFIAFLVPSDDLLLPIVRENLNDIERKNLTKYNLIHKSKAEIHSWLSLQ